MWKSVSGSRWKSLVVVSELLLRWIGLALGVAGALVILIIVLVWLVKLWGELLDRRERDPDATRRVLLTWLAVTSAVQLCASYLWWSAVPYAVLWTTIADFWGGLDVVLRFPAEHTLCSLFGLKQLALLAVKTAIPLVGTVLSTSPGGISAAAPGLAWVVCSLSLLVTWVSPIAFLMALPLDPAEHVLKDDSKDIDIALRAARLVLNPSERRHLARSIRGYLPAGLFSSSSYAAKKRQV